MVKVEIDGKELAVEQGSMIIEAADDAGIHIPRFCYHKKLPIAANCRMCLVQVANAPKPLPACATPVADGMKVLTKSKIALEAQKGVMEFLLINHPLDCPVCDQGGECELQDLSMGFGAGISRFAESKRAVEDKEIGPLIYTTMTRCIHCTRCIRFGENIAGQMELGATGRGEHMEVGTYLAKSIESELSGNVIDLCPVGALNSKPFNSRARTWDLYQYPAIAPHDCLGSNIQTHIYNNKVYRVIPKENEAINETWLSDKDRFSYEGIYHESRLTKPMIRKNNQLIETSWQEALEFAAAKLQTTIDNHSASEIGALVSPNSTTEEFFLLQKMLRALGCSNIDHRLRQRDFTADAYSAKVPLLGFALQDLDNAEAALIIGSNFRHEQPLACQRLRKASMQDAYIAAINPVDFNLALNVSDKIIAAGGDIANAVAQVAKSIINIKNLVVDEKVQKLLQKIESSDTAHNIARQMLEKRNVKVIAGDLVLSHPAASKILFLIDLIAKLTEAKLGIFTEGANAAGAWLAGAVPHRLPGGFSNNSVGLNASQIVEHKLKNYILFGVEPELDHSNSRALLQSLTEANSVIAISSFITPELFKHADVLLPLAVFAETSGTFVNVEGKWQSFNGSAKPVAESRPGWKILRVLANFLQLEGFEYASSQEVLEEIKPLATIENAAASYLECPEYLNKPRDGLTRIAPVPIYRTDSLVRRAKSLQQTVLNPKAAVVINSKVAKQLGFADGDEVKAIQHSQKITLPIQIDEKVPDDSVMIAAGLTETIALSDPYGPIELQRG